jgi:hypothetical protein
MVEPLENIREDVTDEKSGHPTTSRTDQKMWKN